MNKDFHEAVYEEQKYYNKAYGDRGNYYRKNVKELFAQGYAEYFYREEFKANCPKTRRKIKKVLKNL